MIGPGKYDVQCEAILREVKADGVLLIVLGGNNGSGFSACFEPHVVVSEAMSTIPAELRRVADEIARDVGTLKS